MPVDTENRHAAGSPSDHDSWRPVVVFVHGFGSSKACWTREGATGWKWPWSYDGPGMGDVATQDADFTDHEFAYFEYDTRWFNVHFLRKIPTILELGEGLKTWLRTRGFSKRPTTLVGHSQGGLVILSYLWNVLNEKEAPSLRHVRQVVLVATPQKGSALLLSTRSIIGRLLPNPQEARLRPLNESVDRLLADITRDVLGADTLDERDSWPVPIHSYYGLEDGIVSKESARGELDPGAVDAIAGDHFTVLRPKNLEDSKYLAIKQAVLKPIGHKNLLLIERYQTSMIVQPVEKTERVTFKNRTSEIPVKSVCQLNREVSFSERNVCEERLLIRYRTEARDGFLLFDSGGTADRGEIDAAIRQEYEDDGRQIRFLYRPRRRAGDECYLKLTVYNGYNTGNTKAHFHLRPLDKPLIYIESLEYVVDLSAYLGSETRVAEPQLFLHPHNPQKCDALCNSRIEKDRIEPTSRDAGRGVWKWRMTGIDGGVVDLFWDVHP